MPRFTIETTYRLPVYRHRTYEAETVEQACRLAIEGRRLVRAKGGLRLLRRHLRHRRLAGRGYSLPGQRARRSVTVRRGHTAQGRLLRNPPQSPQGSDARARGRTIGLAVLAAAHRCCDRQSRGDPRRSGRSCDRRRRAVSEYIVKIGFWLRGYDDFTVEANSNGTASNRARASESNRTARAPSGCCG